MLKPCDSPHFAGQCCIGAKSCIGGIMWGERGKRVPLHKLESCPFPEQARRDHARRRGV
jgi:hypothetical protein